MIRGILSAYESWLEFNTQTKLLGVLLVVLILLWFKEEYKKQETFFCFTVLAFLLCIFPVTAYLLGLYQSLIYKGVWIFCLVPILPMLAYGITLYLSDYLSDRQRGRWERGIVAVAVAGLLFLCSGAKPQYLNEENHTIEMDTVSQILDTAMSVGDEMGVDNLTIWAPEEVLTYARVLKPGIALYYGRDMWQAELEYFTDDRYTDLQRRDYDWMKFASDLYAVGEDADYQGARRIHDALHGGVNCLVLSPNTDERIVKSIETRFFKTAIRVQEYYLFVFTEDEVKRLA